LRSGVAIAGRPRREQINENGKALS
jgi:hypothetical protein